MLKVASCPEPVYSELIQRSLLRDAEGYLDIFYELKCNIILLPTRVGAGVSANKLTVLIQSIMVKYVH